MNYKTRLTLLFVGLFFFVLTSILSFIYISYSEFRRDEFFERLREKGVNTARLLIDVKKVDIGLLKIIDQNSINKMYDEKILVFDTNNKLVYSSLDDEAIPYSTTIIHSIRERGDKYYVDKDGDEVVGIHFTGQGQDLVVLASAYDRYGISKLDNLQKLVIAALLLGTVLIAAASYFYIRQVFRPIDELNTSIQTINENNLKEFIAVKKNRDELDKLASNYNEMLARLYKAFESQRTFVRNAAHELKTPLAVIHTKLEKLEELSAGEHPEIQQLTNSLLAEVGGHATLIESLLLMQRLQSSIPIEFSKIRIDELLFESATELNVVYQTQKISIDIDSSVQSEGQLTIRGNTLLFKICFRNLIENASIHAPTNILSIRISSSSHFLHLHFINAGEDPIPSNLIFEPFYRHTTHPEKPGNGLGLSIVKQIIELMHGTVEYRFEDSCHHFLIHLPQA